MPALTLGSSAEGGIEAALTAPPAGAAFVLAGDGRRIELRLEEGYEFSQIYAPADDEVIAFEPMTAPANALLRGGPELRSVEPGQAFTASFSIQVSSGA